MSKTTNFGLEKFGAEGRLSDNGFKFTGKDREIIDALLFTLANHDHRKASGVTATLAGPIELLNLTQAVSGGVLAGGTTYFYKVSYTDFSGNETAAGPGFGITTPLPLSPPPVQTPTTLTTGGTVEPGTYKFALSFFQTAGGETNAPNISTIVVPTGTSTNTITITAPTIPADANGYKIYIKRPADFEYFLLKTVASGNYTWTGADLPDCAKKRPFANTSNQTNKVTITINALDLPLDSRVAAWNVYRTTNAGVYPSSSLVTIVNDTVTQGGTDLVTTIDDTGTALTLGVPLDQTAILPTIPQLAADDVFASTSDPLPAAFAPRGLHAFQTFMPGTLVVKDYMQTFLPEDLPCERLDCWLLTAATGVNGSNFVTIRASDNGQRNEKQQVYNDAATVNEKQSFFNNATGGTFILSHGANASSAIAFDATNLEMETGVQTISSITDVSVFGSGTVDDPWIVEFLDPGAQDVTELTSNDAGLTGGTTTIATTIPGSDGGTFTLTFDGQTTSAQLWNESAANLETDLEALSNITAVTVTGTGIEADPWEIEFVNPGNQNVKLLQSDDSLLGNNGTSFISTSVAGRANTVVDVDVTTTAQNQFFQTSTDDFASQEAEDAPAFGGSLVSDILATNDAAMEIGAQNEFQDWRVGTLLPGDYTARFYVSDADQTGTFKIEVSDYGTDEVQSIFNGATGGTFTISFDGQGPTAAIAFNAAASVLETELELFSNIDDVTVTGAGTVGDPWIITFLRPGKSNIAQITANDTNLTGGTPTSTIATDTAGVASSVIDTNSFTLGISGYEPPWELDFTSAGTEDFEFVVTKTDAGAGVIRIDKYEYLVLLPTFHKGATLTVEVLVTGTPTTNGDDVTATIWY